MVWFLLLGSLNLRKLYGVSLVQVDVGLAPRRADALAAPGAHRLGLAREIRDADLPRSDAVELFDRARDLRFRRARGHGEGVDALLGREQCFLGEPRCADDLMRDAFA